MFSLHSNQYGKAPVKKEASIKHPFHLATHTCYLHVIPFQNSGLLLDHAQTNRAADRPKQTAHAFSFNDPRNSM